MSVISPAVPALPPTFRMFPNISHCWKEQHSGRLDEKLAFQPLLPSVQQYAAALSNLHSSFARLWGGDLGRKGFLDLRKEMAWPVPEIWEQE